MGIINVANGNLHIEIPLALASQRGGLEYSAKFTYDSRVWSRAVVTPVWAPATNFGWNLVESNAAIFGRNVGTHTCQCSCGPNGQTCPATWYSYSNYFIKDFTGTRRDFPIYFESSCQCHTAESPTPSGAANTIADATPPETVLLATEVAQLPVDGGRLRLQSPGRRRCCSRSR